MHVVVIGAGVVGAAIAYRLAAASASVTIVDGATPGSGTSSTSFAWLNANDKPPAAYHALNAEGVRAHHRLALDLGGGDWLHATGMLQAVPGNAEGALDRHVGGLRAVGYAAHRVDRGRAAALEPDVTWPMGTVFAHFPEEGWANGPALARALVAAAQALGADLRVGEPVTGIGDGSGPGTALVTASGSRLAADAVVIAAGRWSDQVAALAGLRLPLAPTCGLLAVTAPLPQGPRSVVYAPGVHFRPDGGGRVVLQDDATDASVGPDTPPASALPGCRELLRRAAVYLPALRDASLSGARVGVRALPADGYPVVGFVPQRPGLYLAVTHSGMTLAPLFGEIAAAEIVRDVRDARLATFRPERCVIDLP